MESPTPRASLTAQTPGLGTADFHKLNILCHLVVSGLDTEITGFPGEKAGHQWTDDDGEFKKVLPKGNAGYLGTYVVDATKGNSGSPVIIVDE